LASEYGVDAKHVEDIGLLHHDDPEIVDSAGGVGQPVVLVTKDADFVDLLQRRGPPPVVVWVRTGNITNRELRRIVLAAWPKAAALIHAGESLVEIRRDSAGAT
jgi:predicted nuclease of predicted toxin-antitoxin system